MDLKTVYGTYYKAKGRPKKLQLKTRKGNVKKN